MSLDTMAERLFRMTPGEARRENVCVRCKTDVSPEGMTDLDWREYLISAICPNCWVTLFPDDEADDD